MCALCGNVEFVLDILAPTFAGALGADVAVDIANILECAPGCATGRVLLGPIRRSLQATEEDGASGTTNFVLLFSGPSVRNLSDAQVLSLIKDVEGRIKALLEDGGINASIDFDELVVVGPPAGAPSWSTKKNKFGKKGKKDKKDGKSTKKKKSSSNKSSKKKGKSSKLEKKGKGSKFDKNGKGSKP